jgi:hypothetical protein
MRLTDVISSRVEGLVDTLLRVRRKHRMFPSADSTVRGICESSFWHDSYHLKQLRWQYHAEHKAPPRMLEDVFFFLRNVSQRMLSLFALSEGEKSDDGQSTYMQKYMYTFWTYAVCLHMSL